MGIKMRPLVLGLSSGQTWPENHPPLFGGFDGGDDGDDDGDIYIMVKCLCVCKSHLF